MRESWVRKNLLSSLVVFLVAIPLAMGIAMVSGMPPAAGLITCIVGGIIVGLISGSPLQVSGPAAGLSVVVYEIIQQHGIEKLGVVIAFAGLVQIIAGLLRFGQVFRCVSPAVVNGMLSGIGVLIFASQFHVMLGSTPKATPIESLIAIPQMVFHAIASGGIPAAGILGACSILAILVWEHLPLGKLKVIPSSLSIVVLATAATSLFHLPVKCVEIPNSLFASVHLPHWHNFLNFQLFLEGIALAVIASAETLLSATAVDRMQTHVKAKYDQELCAQGVGNTLCGLMGALPLTGVIVRSSVNIQSGATSRLSTILHGLWILLLAVLFPQLLRLVPIATLAALLVFTGYKLMNFKIVTELAKYGKAEVAIYGITVATIVATDLLTGVITGVLLSVVKLLYVFSRLETEQVTEDGKVFLHLKGAATFLNLPRLSEVLDSVPPNTELHIDLHELTYVDHAAIDLILAWAKQREETGETIVVDWSSLGCLRGNSGIPVPKTTPAPPDEK